MRIAIRFLVAIVLMGIPTVSRASIYGTMSNFDTFNTTPEDAYGAEIELEGIHPEDIAYTYPAHYDQESRISYQLGAGFGTRIRYSGYNFSTQSYLPANSASQSTNGHACVGTAGCEHFGFSLVGAQPTEARFYWLDQSGSRIGLMPESIATPTWNYVPANGGGAPRLEAVVEAPEPAEFHIQRPDSIWMKVWRIEIDRPVDLAELVSDNPIIPDDVGEVESEWELLEGGIGKEIAAADDVPDGKFAVIRRYEYFEYTGPYDAEHEPTSIFLEEDLPAPPIGELGQFISANMVAANLAAPQDGDFDQDGDVNGRDFLAWQRGYGLGTSLEDGDANWDDRVDHEDLVIWQNLYHGEDVLLLSAVPEPTTFLIGSLGLLATLSSRSSRRGSI